MNFHLPPTDSLYKFLAISGILLLIYSSLIHEVLVERYEIASNTTLLEFKLASAESEYLDSRLHQFNLNSLTLKELKKETKHLIGKYKKSKDPKVTTFLAFLDREKIDLIQDLKQFKQDENKIYDDIAEAHHKFLLQSAKADAAHRAYTWAQLKEKKAAFSSSFFGILGLLIFVVGMIMWYLKVQIPMDQRLANEVRKDENIQSQQRGYMRSFSKRVR